MKCRKLTALFLCLTLLAALFAGCGSGSGSNTSTAPAANEPSADDDSAAAVDTSNAEFKIRFGHDDTDTSTYHYGLLEFKRLVEERSEGRVSVEIFPSGQLGSSRDMTEGLQLGTLECAFAVTAVLTNFVPEFNVLDAPFIFEDYQHAYRVVDGDIGQELNQMLLDQQGCRVMGYMDVGYRHVYSSKPVRTLEDLKGLKIRTMQSDLNMAVFNKLGAIATPMAGNEVFTALQQNTIDAAENAVQYVLHQKLYEVTPYITYTGHFYNFCAIMISEQFYQSLPEDLQQIVMEAGTEATDYQRELSRKANEDAAVTLAADYGVEFIEDIDKEALIEAVSSIYDDFADSLPADMIERIRNA